MAQLQQPTQRSSGKPTRCKWLNEGFAGHDFGIILRKEYPGLYLELKRIGQKPRPDQIAKMKQLRDVGYCVESSDNLESSKQIILKYLYEINGEIKKEEFEDYASCF